MAISPESIDDNSNPFEMFRLEAEQWLKNIEEGSGMKGWEGLDSDYIRENWPNNLKAVVKENLKKLPSFKALLGNETGNEMSDQFIEGQAGLAMLSYQAWRRKHPKK